MLRSSRAMSMVAEEAETPFPSQKLVLRGSGTAPAARALLSTLEGPEAAYSVVWGLLTTSARYVGAVVARPLPIARPFCAGCSSVVSQIAWSLTVNSDQAPVAADGPHSVLSVR